MCQHPKKGPSPRGNRRRGHIICEIRRIRCETSQSQRTSRIHMWDAMGRMPHVYHVWDSAGGIVERCGTTAPDHQKTHHEILAFLSDFKVRDSIAPCLAPPFGRLPGIVSRNKGEHNADPVKCIRQDRQNRCV